MTPAPALAAGRRDRRWTLAVVAVTLVAGALRLVRLRYVPEDEYYDAAVRSMSLSLHNFLYGAFEPGGSAAIDKPPLDLWLQVVAVKLLGYGPTVLKLPEALAGAAAVPLLYDLVRRVSGRAAGLASAAVLALLPLSVVTSRSDTMDSVMMALLVATAWLLLAAAQRRHQRWLIAAAVVLGLAFNVKLFEALVPLPAFLVFAWLCLHEERLRVRLARLLAAGAVFASVACTWLVFVSLTPAHDRPYPIGSTNGSVWNAVFVYNGIDRISQPAQHRTFSTAAARAAPVATVSSAARTLRPAVASSTVSRAGPIRLFVHNAIDYGGLIGTALFAALLLGSLCAAPSLRRRPRVAPNPTREAVIERAALSALATWLLTGYALFSFASRVHPRYLESFTPSIAVALGVSAVTLARRGGGARARALLPLALVVCVIESAAGSGRISRAGLYLVALAAIGAVVAAVRIHGRSERGIRLPRWCTPSAVASLLLAVLLALVLLIDDVRLIHDDSGVQAAEVTLPPSLTDPLSDYLIAHQDGARYEVAVSAPQLAAPLIIRAARPLLLLTSVDARPLLSLTELRADAARGEVRYVFIHGICPGPTYTTLPACSAAARWVRAHATDVTAQLHINTTSGLLYRLPTKRRS
jgi:4-amino-4-deoxy-L-arabinose transferase-like glycosyltransferase